MLFIDPVQAHQRLQTAVISSSTTICPYPKHLGARDSCAQAMCPRSKHQCTRVELLVWRHIKKNKPPPLNPDDPKRKEKEASLVILVSQQWIPLNSYRVITPSLVSTKWLYG